MKRGEIRWYTFRLPDKRRPVLLLTRDGVIEHLNEIEWIVHAVHCARPNLALRRVLENRGFQVRHIPGVGHAYHRVEHVV